MKEWDLAHALLVQLSSSSMNSFLSLSSHNKNFFLLLCTSADGRHGSFICQKIIIGLVITMAEISNPTPTQNPGRPGFLALVTIILAVLFSMKNSPLSLAGQSYQKVWSFFLFLPPSSIRWLSSPIDMVFFPVFLLEGRFTVDLPDIIFLFSDQLLASICGSDRLYLGYYPWWSFLEDVFGWNCQKYVCNVCRRSDVGRHVSTRCGPNSSKLWTTLISSSRKTNKWCWPSSPLVICRLLMLITSIKPIRDRWYGLFYWVHVQGYIAIFVGGMLHTPIMRPVSIKNKAFILPQVECKGMIWPGFVFWGAL